MTEQLKANKSSRCIQEMERESIKRIEKKQTTEKKEAKI